MAAASVTAWCKFEVMIYVTKLALMAVIRTKLTFCNFAKIV
jgi:hypothetical protein